MLRINYDIMLEHQGARDNFLTSLPFSQRGTNFVTSCLLSYKTKILNKKKKKKKKKRRPTTERKNLLLWEQTPSIKNRHPSRRMENVNGRVAFPESVIIHPMPMPVQGSVSTEPLLVSLGEAWCNKPSYISTQIIIIITH